MAVAETLASRGIIPLALGDNGIWASTHLLESFLLGSLGPESYRGLWTGSTSWRMTTRPCSRAPGVGRTPTPEPRPAASTLLATVENVDSLDEVPGSDPVRHVHSGKHLGELGVLAVEIGLRIEGDEEL